MNATRKEFLAGAFAAAAAAGCKYVPTPDQGKVIGAGVGGATGLIMDPCVEDDEVRNAIVKIVEEIGRCAPQEGETIRDAWTRIANAHVKELVDSGKITKVQGDAILAAFDLVLKGWAILEERHPEVRTWSELTVAVIGGFCGGFLAVFKPVNANAESDCAVDPTAFKALRRSTDFQVFRMRQVYRNCK